MGNSSTQDLFLTLPLQIDLCRQNSMGETTFLPTPPHANETRELFVDVNIVNTLCIGLFICREITY